MSKRGNLYGNIYTIKHSKCKYIHECNPLAIKSIKKHGWYENEVLAVQYCNILFLALPIFNYGNKA